MFKNSYKLMFMITLIMGTLITISSTSWLSAWMGLEINLLSFIPLMNEKKNLLSSESSLKYFLIQALASSMLIFITIFYLLNYNNLNLLFNFNNFMNLGIISSLMLKCGIAPFHFWFPSIIEGLSWVNAFFLLTWQKIAPLILISYTNLNFLIIPILLSMIFGSLGGLNQTSLRKIMAYSSINHLGWMGSAMMISNSFWWMYFLFYTFLSSTVIMFFNNFNLFYLNQLFSFSLNSNSLKLTSFLNLLSLGGLPPFLGFLPKWNIIQLLTENNQLFLMSMMVILTLITLYFYLRITFSSFMMNYYEPKWNFLNYYNNIFISSFYFMSFISIFGLPFINMFII
nr:NADH dehydrogenase subunit 2 [Metopina sagittata]